SVSAAATSPRGTKKPVIRPTFLAVARDLAAAPSSPRVASINACVPRPRSRQTRASIAANSLFLGDIHSVPLGRRFSGQLLDALTHHVVVALLPAERSRLAVQLVDQLERLGKLARAIEFEERRLVFHQLAVSRCLRHRRVAQQGKGPRRLGLALD